ncbi:MAG TPA: serine/threonine-protein kinase [Polyangiaceae bacterium]|nr:serine/threonine-protein kinase [Polyangiaceae bacterium]
MSTEVHEGQILAGKFRIERVLGRGGMGIVVAATHLQLDERVALKFLLPEALINPEAVERFAREARAAVKIKSEHVARVSDVGTLESGSPYMVMEYLHGEDLAGWVRRNGAMPMADAIEFLLQACEAIAEAHALGIVHRDLKPANLFVTRRVDGSPCIKVLDFGISKVTVPGVAPEFGMTKTSTVMGSPLYMSPEQMSSSRDVDLRTDIWALGVILYESLTGRVPFEAETMPQLCGMILQDPPRPIRELRPDLPQGLQHAVLRCLEKNRERRFNNVAELAYALAPFGQPAAQRSAERISRVLGAVGISSAPGAAVAASSRPGSGTNTNFGASTEAKKSRAPLVVALCALGALLGGAVLFLTHKTPALESVPEHPSVTPVAAAPAPSAPASPPAIEPQLPAPSATAAPTASAPSPAPSAVTPKTKAKAKAVTTTPKPVAAQPAAPAIDPLDGRR